jgi:hypothetical protein
LAFTPCAFHGAKYSGGANTFFLRLVRGGESLGGKLQCCANCASLAMAYLADHATKVSEGDQFLDHEEPSTCGNCRGQLAGQEWTLFGNAYPRGHSESQWWAKVCEVCVEAVTNDLHLLDAVGRRS